MRYTKEQIDQWISEWEESGQSIIKYCDGKPFDKSTFYNWRKNLTPSSITKQKSKFVPLQVNPAFIPQPVCRSFTGLAAKLPVQEGLFQNNPSIYGWGRRLCSVGMFHWKNIPINIENLIDGSSIISIHKV